MNFGGEHSAHCLRYGQAPRIRPGAFGWPSAPAPKRARGGCCHRRRPGGFQGTSQHPLSTAPDSRLSDLYRSLGQACQRSHSLRMHTNDDERTIRVKYYARYRDRGMPHGKALKAVARKRLKVIYAIMRDKVPYVA